MHDRVQGSVFSFLAGLFSKHAIKTVLAGGYAMNAYKLQRMTFDIDFVIREADLTKLEPDILHAGYSVFNRTNAFIQYKSKKPQSS